MTNQITRSSPSGDGVLIGTRVLVIEDDPFVAWKLSADLSKHGAIVYSPRREARNIESLFGPTPWLEKVDVAILDVNLETHTSEEMAKRLHAEGIPFVFHTGDNSSVGDFLLDFDVPVIPKPTHIDVIVRTLQNVLTSSLNEERVHTT
ncbi:CheY-like chemotaxis protein [Palleronia aestuarii]|uniref:CheY-like chemotaxis protein n=1 Tax=Palleronia aestuarii TaxID=568105 RepID=A0A2W7NEB8_9RHOB|nr:response regulator [Palleronia aestuarii]PZX09662.1 CheY-like chemotaxis protein [Palleronia aestuarii]